MLKSLISNILNNISVNNDNLFYTILIISIIEIIVNILYIIK